MTTQGPFRHADRALLFSGAGSSWPASSFSCSSRAAVIATWAMQRFVTFPSAARGAANPAALAAAGGEQLWLDADGARVEAWLLPARGARHRGPLVIYAHGNGELIDMRAADFARAARRGHRRAAGRISRATAARAARPPRRAHRRAGGRVRLGRTRSGASMRSASWVTALARRWRHRATRGAPSARGAGARVDLRESRGRRDGLRRAALAADESLRYGRRAAPISAGRC